VAKFCALSNVKTETNSTFTSGQPIEAFDLFLLLFSQLTARELFYNISPLRVSSLLLEGGRRKLKKKPT